MYYIYTWNDGPKGFSSKHITPIKFSVDDDRFLFVISWELVSKGMQTGMKLWLNLAPSLFVCALLNCQCSFSPFIKMRCKYYIHAHNINARTHARTHLTICNATQHRVYKKLNCIRAISRMARHNVFTSTNTFYMACVSFSFFISCFFAHPPMHTLAHPLSVFMFD